MYEVDRDSLKAVNKTFRALPKDLKNNLRKYQRSEATPIWKEEMASKSGLNELTQAVFKKGNTVKAGAVLTLRAGSSNKRLSGGATPAELARPVEFGTTRRDKYTKYYRTSPNGNRHTVTRRTSRQLPPRRRGGYVVYPAANPAISRLTRLHVQTVIKSIYEATEKR